MGAWGTGAWANDDALDWVATLLSEGPQAISKAFEAVVPGDYIEEPIGAVVVAATDTVAAALGKPGGDLPDDVRQWLATHSVSFSEEDLVKARASLDRVAASSGSELRELWSGTTDKSNWLTVVADLQNRLTGQP